MKAQTLTQFSSEQEEAVNKAAKQAWTILTLKAQWDMEAWFNNLRKVNPYFKGVGIKEFGSAVLSIKVFKNT